MNERTEKDLKEIFGSAIDAVDPSRIVTAYAEDLMGYIQRRCFGSVYVAGFGKASFRMAETLVRVLGADTVTKGIVVTKYGHASGFSSAGNAGNSVLRGFRVYEAGHPIPDENGVRAAAEISSLLSKAGPDALVICLVSGGGSALLVSPAGGITLEEKQKVTDLLLRAGADITELNTVRKHLSSVKGGRLAESAYPAEVVSLMISDVIGDPLDVIASGPTAPDASTFADALEVLDKYKLTDEAPQGVIDHLESGRAGAVPDTPREDSYVFHNVRNIIIGSNRKALQAALTRARSLGYESRIIDSGLTGEAAEAGRRLASLARAARAEKSSGGKICLLSGGETTVTVKGQGRGGRNTEVALAFAIGIEGVQGISLLSAGTDGTDGPTDAAGAMVDGETIKKARADGLDPEASLGENDSYSFFSRTGSLLKTGPTGTNVMDVQIILIEDC
jgi:hydroxypyruvate reductase/glycerate 2-kinase